MANNSRFVYGFVIVAFSVLFVLFVLWAVASFGPLELEADGDATEGLQWPDPLSAGATAFATLFTAIGFFAGLLTFHDKSQKTSTLLGSETAGRLLFADWAEDYQEGPDGQHVNLFGRLYKEDQERTNLFDRGTAKFHYARIATSMERLGTLVEAKVVDVALVTDLIGDRVLRTWWKMQASILAKRDARGRFGNAFEAMAAEVLLDSLARKPASQWAKIEIGNEPQAASTIVELLVNPPTKAGPRLHLPPERVRRAVRRRQWARLRPGLRRRLEKVTFSEQAGLAILPLNPER